MLHNNPTEEAVFHAIQAGDWDRAFDHAKNVPANWDIWQRLPSAHQLPDQFVNRVLDLLSNKKSNQNQNLGSFIFELAHHLPGDPVYWKEPKELASETMNRVAELGMNDPYVVDRLFNSANFTRNKKHQDLAQATDFWHGYEKSVQPHHFAVVKSLYTGKPEEIKDHRGKIGSSKDYMHLLPALLAHSKEVQQRVMEDEDIPKRMFKGEPYVRLYRGVNGHYGKLIREKAKYDPSTNQVDEKNFLIPTAHLTSWTVDPKMASKFVWGRADIAGQPGDQGVVMNQWVPVKSILHSGFHRTTPGQQHAHHDESELVVGHPQGKIKVATSSMQFQPSPMWHPDDPKRQSVHSAKNYGEVALPDIRKSEYAPETIDIFDIMNASLIDPTVIGLEKNMLKRFVPAATALALLGAPQEVRQRLPVENMPVEVQQTTEQMPVQSLQRVPPMPAAGLKPIKMIESSSGKNTNHREMTTGPHAGTSAYGVFGLMPMTIVDTVSKNPVLRQKYPDLSTLDYKDNKRVHQAMAAHPQAEVDIANAHWNHLRNIFGSDENKMAHAWLNGITKTLETPEEVINSHPYVQKYLKFKNMLKLEQKRGTHPTPIQKSEDHDPKEKGDFADIKKFVPFTDVMQNHRSIKQINDAIASGQIHDLSNVGKFTHSSFVAGFDPDNSWLIKVEPFGERPGIESVSKGLQTVKEVAFYYLANRIFNLGFYTPHAILGEIQKDDGEKGSPAVAIRMYPQTFISAVDMDKERPRSMQGILEKYRRSGELHKLAIMLYILGEADAHGNNVLTDGSGIKLIDHGSSFGDMKFDPAHEKNVFVPYFLRAWGFKDSMSPDDKYRAMPKIDSGEVEENVRHWLMNLSKYDLIDIMKRFYLDPQPAVERLERLQEIAKTEPVDTAINSLWTKGA